METIMIFIFSFYLISINTIPLKFHFNWGDIG